MYLHINSSGNTSDHCVGANDPIPVDKYHSHNTCNPHQVPATQPTLPPHHPLHAADQSQPPHLNSYLDFVNHSTSDQLSFEDRIAMLIADQRRIFDSVDNHLQNQKQHETGECRYDFKTLWMFVSGVGGMGKSFLIEAIKLLVGRFGRQKKWQWLSLHPLVYLLLILEVWPFTGSFSCP